MTGSAAFVPGSSSTVLANLSFLIGAVVLAVLAAVIIWLRHRQPKSTDANMAAFRRGLSALAPDNQPPPVRRSDAVRPVRPTSQHVRVTTDDQGGRSG